MKFADQDDNRKLIERLENSVTEGRVSHAYLFEGSGNVDKADFAKSFIKGVLCPDGRGENCGKCDICDKIDHDNYEDIFYISKDGKSVKDSAIIEMQERMKVKPLRGKNVAVIKDADLMTARAQNRLLKTLEEPVGDAMMILLSENMENLAGTILSRCVKFRINGPSTGARSKKGEKLHANAEEIVEMSLRREPFYKVRTILNIKNMTDDDVNQFLDEMELVYRNLIIDNDSKDIPLYDFDSLYEGIYHIEETRKEIRANVSASYALKNLFLKIGG